MLIQDDHYKIVRHRFVCHDTKDTCYIHHQTTERFFFSVFFLLLHFCSNGFDFCIFFLKNFWTFEHLKKIQLKMCICVTEKIARNIISIKLSSDFTIDLYQNFQLYGLKNSGFKNEFHCFCYKKSKVHLFWQVKQFIFFIFLVTSKFFFLRIQTLHKNEFIVSISQITVERDTTRHTHYIRPLKPIIMIIIAIKKPLKQFKPEVRYSSRSM